ncbi:MAG: FGGY family carbohydrate kinase, partial [Candidatus Omnitrophota bacterium]
MSKPYILALDLGTTGNRAIVFDRRRRVIFSAYREFPQSYPKPGWVEHDPQEIWKTAAGVLDQALRAVGRSKIEAVGITNQRETVVVWDRRTSKPVYPAIVWQCRRSASFCRRLKDAGLEPMIRSKTGLFLDAYFSASKIRWILDHVHCARSAAERGDLLAGTIDSWVLWKLTKGLEHLTDTSNASRTMLFDLKTRDWDESLCRLFKIPESMLPRIVPTSAVSCRITSSGIPVAAIVGDQQAAAFAQGCFDPAAVKNTYGTGLFMLKTTGRRPVLSKNLLTTVAWSIGDLKSTEYAVEG